MDVTIDGERNFQLTGDPPDVLSVVAAASDLLRAKGRAILRLRVDDETITPQDVVVRLKDLPLDRVQQILIESEDLSSLVESSLAELQKVLPELPAACRSLAELFHGDNPEEGFEPFVELAEIWGHIKTREILVADALNLNMAEMRVGADSVARMHEELNGYLEEAAGALEARDTVLLGDLLEYELAPRAERELDIVNVLQSEVASRTS
jgi:hypothetical protein